MPTGGVYSLTCTHKKYYCFLMHFSIYREVFYELMIQVKHNNMNIQYQRDWSREKKEQTKWDSVAISFLLLRRLLHSFTPFSLLIFSLLLYAFLPMLWHGWMHRDVDVEGDEWMETRWCRFLVEQVWILSCNIFPSPLESLKLFRLGYPLFTVCRPAELYACKLWVKEQEFFRAESKRKM